MRQIAVAGHICADLTPTLPPGIGTIPGQLQNVGPITIRPGGCVANTGQVLVQLGLPVRTAGLVGDDDLGQIVVRGLGELGLSTRDIHIAPGSGTSYSIVIEPPGMNRSFWHHTGASDVFDGTSIDLDNLELLHLGYPPLLPGLLTDAAKALVTLLKRIRAAGITTSLDMAVVDRSNEIGRLDWHSIMSRTLKHVDVFSPSLDDLTSTLEIGPVSSANAIVRVADQLIADGVGIVMISAGEDGLLLRTGSAERLKNGGVVLNALSNEWVDATVWAPSHAITEMVTTNGAGDAASAGLIYGLVSGLSPKETAAIASLVASQWIQNLPIDVQETV